MIFIGGISSGQRELNYKGSVVICGGCGSYGRYQVFMTYMYFSFFFIPLFKWNKRYFVKMSCCGAVYELDSQTGAAIVRGQDVEIQERNLTLIQAGKRNPYEQDEFGEKRRYKVCRHCGYQFDNDDFEYCPKCGKSLKSEE
ncbi:MAG: zinc ribbon domain-containing protein [Lachnoclostridium edouardi]|uniref:zinc ribbon domain-containing protein n=1 Tax=Lachnoclostridium edouardi TaxID=1926283 RepID=UPI0026DDC52A|nr:zinc ribbon domain-containing protein [Lachnoclostridium edouardi]MDO4278548.1 zinc ribbon domain-containing protein [Lachnoclostridium edouardi]